MTFDKKEMIRRVVQKWCEVNAKPEYRFDIFKNTGEKNIYILLKTFRDKKANLEGVPFIEDLGLKDGQDFISLWSSNKDGMKCLHEWALNKGYETSGLWL
jgi:hypothetical protein